MPEPSGTRSNELLKWLLMLCRRMCGERKSWIVACNWWHINNIMLTIAADCGHTLRFISTTSNLSEFVLVAARHSGHAWST